MGYIYISYSRQNSEIAQRLVASLQEGGYTVWVDSADLTPGMQWGEQIASAINDAEVFVTLLSPATVGNRTILNEIELALARRKPIIPVLIKGATILPSLTNRQAVGATGDWDNFIERLTNAIDASTASLHIRRMEAPPVPAPAAILRAAPVRARPNLLVITVGLLVLVAIIVVLGLALVSPSIGNIFSNVVSNLETTSSAGTRVSDLSSVEMTATSIVLLNATSVAQLVQTQTQAAVDESQMTQPAALTETPTPVMSNTPRPTVVANEAALTATALANTIELTDAEFLDTTLTPDGSVPTQLPETGGGDPALGTEIAFAIENTVAAFSATEISQLSPAEAAQMMNLTTGNTNLMFAISILSALALGSSVATLYVIWTGSDLRRVRRRSAHPVAHPTGEMPTQPDSVSTATMLEDYQIFVSSSEKDKAWVNILVEDLETLGYAVWWYAKDAPGLPFGNEIRSAIYHTKIFLITLSPDSMKSKHIEEEIRWAEIYDRPIVPVECRPTSIEERFYGLAKGADIDFTDENNYKEALEFLTQAIDRHLQQRLEKMRIAPASGE